MPPGVISTSFARQLAIEPDRLYIFILGALPVPGSIETGPRWEFPQVLDNQKKDFDCFDSPLAGSRKMV